MHIIYSYIIIFKHNLVYDVLTFYTHIFNNFYVQFTHPSWYYSQPTFYQVSIPSFSSFFFYFLIFDCLFLSNYSLLSILKLKFNKFLKKFLITLWFKLSINIYIYIYIYIYIVLNIWKENFVILSDFSVIISPEGYTLSLGKFLIKHK